MPPRPRKPSPDLPTRPWQHKITRDLVLFISGLALLVKEAIGHEARPPLIAAYLVMMGLSLPIRLDERKNNKGAES